MSNMLLNTNIKYLSQNKQTEFILVIFTLKQCCNWELGDLLAQEVQEVPVAILQSTLLFPDQEKRNTVWEGIPLENTLYINKQLVTIALKIMYSSTYFETLKIASISESLNARLTIMKSERE